MVAGPKAVVLLMLAAIALVDCGGTTRLRRTPGPGGRIQHGRASWYGEKFHGRLTASGEAYDMNALTAAHRKLPFGTVVRVTSKVNGRSVTVRINDRGPFVKGRLIDLSAAAAARIGMQDEGVVEVKIEVLRRPGR
jgi:rare lipoprotein A